MGMTAVHGVIPACPPSPSFAGCLRRLVPQKYLKVRSGAASIVTGTGNELSASGKTTALHKKEASVTWTKISRRSEDGGRYESKDEACLMTVEATAGCLHGWLKADTSIKSHEYSVAK